MNFQDYIQDFTSVTVEQAQGLLAAKEGAVLFIGRAHLPLLQPLCAKTPQGRPRQASDRPLP